MLEKTVLIGHLFDFYGLLLTPKQREIIRLYYFENLSLGEIGETLTISRQAVYDHLHRAEKILQEYEERMGLVKRDRKLKKGLEEIKKGLENCSCKERDGLLEMINRMEKI